LWLAVCPGRVSEFQGAAWGCCAGRGFATGDWWQRSLLLVHEKFPILMN
jgi:hypothetical protein